MYVVRAFLTFVTDVTVDMHLDDQEDLLHVGLSKEVARQVGLQLRSVASGLIRGRSTPNGGSRVDGSRDHAVAPHVVAGRGAGLGDRRCKGVGHT